MTKHTEKLYKVEVSYVLYVLANDENHANRVAHKAAQQDINNCGEPDFLATLVRTKNSVPPDWVNALPFTDKTDVQERSIAQIMKEQEKELASDRGETGE